MQEWMRCVTIARLSWFKHMRKQLIPLLLIQFINTLGYSIIIPVLPFIVRENGGGDITYGMLISSYAAFQFVGAPVLGAVSDQLGRKKVLLVSLAGTVVGWCIFAASWFVPDVSLFGFTTLAIVLIMLSRVIDGITGGNNSVANAYLSDITTPKKRAQYFGLMGAVMGTAFLIGPAIGGILGSSSLGYLAPIMATIGVALLGILLTALFLPESLPPAARTQTSIRTVLHRLNIPKHIRSFAHTPIIANILTVRFLVNFVFSAYIAVVSLYLIDAFGMTEKQIGFFLLAAGLFSIFNQAVLVKQIVARVGEKKMLILGLAATVFGLVSIRLTSSLLIYTLLYYILNLGLSLTNPAIKSLLSAAVTDKQQGEIMGLDESLSALASAVAPLVAGVTYKLLGGNVFVAIALCSTIALVVWGRYMVRTKAEPIT